MMVVTAVSGFIMLVIRSKLPYLWNNFDRLILGKSEMLLLFFAISSLFYLICYYQILERKTYVYYIEFFSIVLTFVFIFPLRLVLSNLKKIIQIDIREFYFSNHK